MTPSLRIFSKGRLTAFLCCFFLICAQAAHAAGYARQQEEEALAKGMRVRRDTAFAWGSLPLLDTAADSALGSLLSALGICTTRQGTAEGGHASLDIMLRNVSVLDIALYAQDGFFLEESNLLDGKAVAFTPDEFELFAGRLSSRSGGALPASLGGLLSLVMQALPLQSGEPEQTAILEGWQEEFLTSVEQLRPKLYLPGLYGSRATTRRLSREALITLAERYVELMEENDARWYAEMGRTYAEEYLQALHETAQRHADSLRALPQWLEENLPEEMEPWAFREIYGEDGVHIASQVDLTLAGAQVFFEWAVQDTTIVPLYAYIAADAFQLQAMLSYEAGRPYAATRSLSIAQNRLLADVKMVYQDVRIEGVFTASETIETRPDKETTLFAADLQLYSEALWGKDVLITLSAEGKDTASGTAGKDYAQTTETALRLKGLGFDDKTILTVKTKTYLENHVDSIPAVSQAIRPALLDEATLDEWLAERNTSLTQALLTALGRLPSDVAAYLLERSK